MAKLDAGGSANSLNSISNCAAMDKVPSTAGSIDSDRSPAWRNRHFITQVIEGLEGAGDSAIAASRATKNVILAKGSAFVISSKQVRCVTQGRAKYRWLPLVKSRKSFTVTPLRAWRATKAKSIGTSQSRLFYPHQMYDPTFTER